jgi:hypothetical protein
MKASVFLKLLSLLQTGFDMMEIANEAKAKEAAGESQEQIYVWIDSIYEDAMREMNETP